MTDSRDCIDCRYAHVWSSSIPCKACIHEKGKPNFKPKLEETMKNQDPKPTLCRTFDACDSATGAVAKFMDYSHPLYEAFDDAVKQATKGKGERHGGDKTPFMDQRWHNIAKSTGVGGLVFQMVKKAEEACEKDDQEAFERELLGALVYGGAAYLYVKQHGFKK